MVPAGRAAAPFVLTPELIAEAYKDLKWTGRNIAKAYKKRKRNPSKRGASRSNIRNPASRIGSNVGTSNSRKVHTYSAGVVNISDDTLFQHVLTLPQEGTSPSQRNRNMINLKGFKLCMEMVLSSAGAGAREYYINVAVLVDRKDRASSSLPSSRFFRDSDGTDRGIDFAAVPDSLGKNCLPLNSDQFFVFMRKKYRIKPAESDGRNTLLIDEYLPINRQIRFSETNTPDTRFHFVYWLNRTASAGVTPTVIGTGQYRHITYFNETCEC